jgi:NMD protein affecting ribosome stability and mRNA decay
MSKNQPRAHVHHHLDRQIEEVRHDPYHPREKLPEPTFCPDCKAVYQEGRWQWLKRPPAFNEHQCPACQRIRDRYPAGFVTLSGKFFAGHRDDVLNLARKEETREKAEHPLQRIIDIQQEDDQTVITTTDLRVAHKIADAIHQAYQGSLEVKFTPDEYRVRIRWSR